MRNKVVAVICIASISLLLVGLFSADFMAIGGKPNPLDSVWQAINGLQSQVNSLNATVAEQQARISELQSQVDTLNASLTELQSQLASRSRVEIATVYKYYSSELIQDNQWHDLINTTLTLDAHATVLAIATTMCGGAIYIVPRMDSSWYEARRKTSYQLDFETNQAFANVDAGTHTFAIQYLVPYPEATIEAYHTRLTLIIIY